MSSTKKYYNGIYTAKRCHIQDSTFWRDASSESFSTIFDIELSGWLKIEHWIQDIICVQFQW